MAPKSHLDLLKSEHLDLTARYSDLKKKYDLMCAATGDASGNGLASSLVDLVKRLHGSEYLSDYEICVMDTSFKSHKFVLEARSFNFKLTTGDSSCGTIADVTPDVFRLVYDWIYTDSMDTSIDDSTLLTVARFAAKFGLHQLTKTCECLFNGRMDISNCIRIFELAEQINLPNLRESCIALVSASWCEFRKEDFDNLSATLLYRLLKSHSSDVLQSIIQLDREDVLLLFLIENDGKLRDMLNDPTSCPCPLEYALTCGRFTIASHLVQNGADVNLKYTSGIETSILVNMIRSENVEACKFLLDNAVELNGVQNTVDKTSPLQEISKSVSTSEMISWLSSIISSCDVNFVSTHDDSEQRSSLILACLNENDDSVAALVPLLLKAGADPNICDREGKSALVHCLLTRHDLPIARQLIEAGADVEHCVEGDPIIHLISENSEAFSFLLDYSPAVDVVNSKGVPLIHRLLLLDSGREESCLNILLSKRKDVDINLRDSDGNTVFHLAVRIGSPLLEHIVKTAEGIDWTRCDKEGRSALQLAIELDNLGAAEVLIRGGADVNETNELGESLLLSSLKKCEDRAAVFLLMHKAKHSDRDATGRSCLEIALTNGMCGAVKELCGAGVNLNERSDCGRGFGVLECALAKGHLKCAALLVSFGCDLESWTCCEDCEQTLLHYMLDQRNESAVVFLIESGCDVSAMRRYNNPKDDDQQSALHTAVTWGLTEAVSALVNNGASLTKQDSDGRTACHLAIREGNHDVLGILLSAKDVSFISTRDKVGQTPLSLAIARRDHKAAAQIVTRLPHAALQTNGNGENLLHVAVRSNDLESVLFLLSTHTDPTRTTQDTTRKTALHLAVSAENELIMRNLILAGCVVDARSSDGNTPLHEACAARRSDLLTILLENGASLNIPDERGDTALLSAVRCGSSTCAKLLLEHDLDIRAVNKKGLSVLHICASLTTDKMEKGSSAVKQCDMLLSTAARQLSDKEMAAFVEARDCIGNTALIIAYTSGNAEVCRTLLRHGASMGARNNDGITLFTYETPTKQLLYGLLETLECEPRWSEADSCDCGAKFSITQRKHHCRHCGRVVCSSCSAVSMPIIKFREEKKVRVCSLCAQVLTQGCR